MWTAGGCIKLGITVGQVDAYGYTIVNGDRYSINLTKHRFNSDAIHACDGQLMNGRLLGVGLAKLSFNDQGRRFRLADLLR